MRQLIWKELREQRYIPFAYGALVIAILGVWYSASAYLAAHNAGARIGISEAGWVLMFALCILGLFSGSGAVASEMGNGTIAFLSTLPAGRWRFWWAKVFAGGIVMGASGVAVLAGYMLIATALFGRAALLGQAAHAAGNWVVFGYVLLFSAYGYAACLFVSTLVDRTIAAVSGGLIGGLAIFLAFGWWSMTLRTAETRPNYGAMMIPGLLAILATGFFAGSYAAFVAQSTNRQAVRAGRAIAMLTIGFVVASIWIVTLGALIKKAIAENAMAYEASHPRIVFSNEPAARQYYWDTGEIRVELPKTVTSDTIDVYLDYHTLVDHGQFAWTLYRNPGCTAAYVEPVSTSDSDSDVSSKLLNRSRVQLTVHARNRQGIHPDHVTVRAADGRALGVIYIENVTE